MKNVAIVGSVGLPAKYGGWETLVDNLTKRLAGVVDFTVYCSSKRHAEKLSEFNGAKLRYISVDANGVQSILYDLISMLMAVRHADTILVLGVSGCVFLPVVKQLSGKKFIVNIDGLEWRRAKWGRFAKWFLRISESVAVHYADVIVADNKAIEDYVLSEYGVNCERIAYGGDHAIRPLRDDAMLRRYGFGYGKYAFKVCRIEPENNIEIILTAFAMQRGLELAIVGNWNNSRYGEDLRSRFSHLEHIHLLDPIYDQAVLNQLRAGCHLYVHGHSAGGTNPSLVEAMSLALPVVAYGCVFNRETTGGQAVYFDSVSELVEILKDLDEKVTSLLGQRMKSVADQLYTWDGVSSKYLELL